MRILLQKPLNLIDDFPSNVKAADVAKEMKVCKRKAKGAIKNLLKMEADLFAISKSVKVKHLEKHLKREKDIETDASLDEIWDQIDSRF